MSKTFDPTKPVCQRDGGAARIICTNCKRSGYPIVALLGDSESVAEYYQHNGRRWPHREDPSDLINIPEKHVRWVSLHRDHAGRIYAQIGNEDDPMNAEQMIACKRIEFEEGEGL